MENLGYYNGKYDLLENMMVPMNDRGCYFGDGVYEACLVREGNVFTMDEHVDRLFRSASMVDIEVPMTKDELRDVLNDLVKKVEGDLLLLYYQVTRGTALRKHDYERGPGNLWVMIKPAKFPDGKARIHLRTQEDVRFLMCNVKTLNLMPSILAAQAAKEAGAYETVFWRPIDGIQRVTECSHSNVSFLKNGELWTAPLDNLILPGITRAHLINVCEQLGVTVHEEPYDLSELFDADEVIVTSSTAFARFADEIDGKPVGGKAPELADAILAALVAEFYE